jgi:hypothetical protein
MADPQAAFAPETATASGLSFAVRPPLADRASAAATPTRATAATDAAAHIDFISTSPRLRRRA